jgi:twinkle protein
MSTQLQPGDVASYLHGKGFQMKRHGHWIELSRCPFCGGGDRSDPGTFAVHSDDGNYVCHRGKCRAAGPFGKLQEHLGDKTFAPLTPKPFIGGKQAYTRPALQPGQVSDGVRDYLSRRGFSEETWKRRMVGETAGDYKILFPYLDEQGGHVFNKMRLARRTVEGERKALREKNGKPILWGMNLAHPSAGPLVITFGEYDALACDEANVLNVVSVPSGDQDLTWVDLCWDWVAQFSEIVLWPDADESGRDALEKVAQRLGKHRIRVVEVGHKDANEMLVMVARQHGAEFAREAVASAVESARYYPEDHIIDFADIPDEPPVRDGMTSGIPELDRITGGFRGGEVTLWSGDNGSGKTTGLCGVIAEAAEQYLLRPFEDGNGPVFVYSGEMKRTKIRYWTELVMAGPRHTIERHSERTGTTYYEIPKSVEQRMREWYRGSLKLYDIPGGTNEANLFERAEFSFGRYGCRSFVFDNLMILTMDADERSEYRRQAQFVQRCKDFAVKYDTHVHLVAHNRKPGDPNEPPGKAAVKGAQEITNLVDNAGAFWRVPRKLRVGEYEGTDALLCWFKSRETGELANIRLVFDGRSKRFAQQSNPARLTKAFGWEDADINAEKADEEGPW